MAYTEVLTSGYRFKDAASSSAYGVESGTGGSGCDRISDNINSNYFFGVTEEST
jgi:hypothetical protein